MEEKEVRLELAKAALKGGASMERMKEMLSWVNGESQEESDLDKISVSELEQYLGMSSVRFRNRCMENGIRTVGQLVRTGSREFRAMRLVGGGLISRLSEVLWEQYGIARW